MKLNYCYYTYSISEVLYSSSEENRERRKGA